MKYRAKTLEPRNITTLKDLIEFINDLEEDWENERQLSEYLGDLLNQTIHTDVFLKGEKDNTFTYSGIGKGVTISYDPCFGITIFSSDTFKPDTATKRDVAVLDKFDYFADKT